MKEELKPKEVEVDPQAGELPDFLSDISLQFPTWNDWSLFEPLDPVYNVLPREISSEDIGLLTKRELQQYDISESLTRTRVYTLYSCIYSARQSAGKVLEKVDISTPMERVLEVYIREFSDEMSERVAARN